MAMTIVNNPSAMLTLGELNKNVSKLGKQLKKVSSGMRINSAGDDASGYAISERMRAQIRGLNQDTQNVQNGKSLLRVAEGGIQSIIEEIRTLKELALNSANDTNTDLDRATIQKEFENRMANINDIATETNYNGKTLLDGTYRRPEDWSSILDDGGIVYPPYNGPNAINGPTGVIEPTGAVTMIAAGDYTISSDGVYMLADGYTGTVTIADGAKNVKIQQQTPSTALHEVSVVGPSTGNANLWIEDLNITNENASGGHDVSIVRFQGTKNVLTVKGNNILHMERNTEASHIPSDAAIVNIGGGLTIEGNSGGSLDISLTSTRLGSYFNIAGIGTDSSRLPDYTPDPIAYNADLVINSGTINVYLERSDAACIGSGWGRAPTVTSRSSAGMHDIIINGGTITATNASGGSPYGGGPGAAIGSGSFGDVNDIIINGGTVIAKNEGGFIDDGASYAATGAGIGTGQGGLVNNIIISSTANVSADTFDEETSPKVHMAAKRDMRILTDVFYNLPHDIGIGTNGIMLGTYNGIHQSSEDEGDGEEDSLHKKGIPLVIHHGTKANQALNVYINDMHTWSLKTDVPSDDDLLELGRLDTTKAAAYQAILSEAANMTLDDAKVVTQHDANVALRVIDGALQYALNEVTHVGAYISRLDFTESNLVTASENTQSSESTLRDADMAKEMAEYTKANVLAQASQSMLAQANQNSSSVLGLLQ